MSLKSEIFERPAVLESLFNQQKERAAVMARTILDRGVTSFSRRPRHIRQCGPLREVSLGLGESAPGGVGRSVVVHDLPDASESRKLPRRGHFPVGPVAGHRRRPDRGPRQGALTLAITNDPSSPLAEQAELVLETCAGPERAIAATKTYTSQLFAISLLSAAMKGDPQLFEALERVPRLVEESLALDSAIERAAQRYRYMSQCVVIGRGFNYATANEWALKLKELAYVVAESYSSADFQHGPIAIVSHGFPILAVVPQGAVFEDAYRLLSSLVDEHGAELVVVSNDATALALAKTPLPLPADLPEWLSPLVSIVPAQLFCYHLTRAKGYDTETPRGLLKVTRTW